MRELAVVVSNDNKNTNPIETINAIKKAGFKNVFIQWYDKEWDISQEEQLKYINKCGLNVIFAHLGYQNINDIWVEGENGEKLVERYKNDIKECKENNILMVIMHLTSKSKAPMYNEIGLERIRKIVDYARELNIKVAFENTKIKGYLEYVFDNIKNDNMGICYDAGHCHAHFDDEFDFVRFKNKIFAVHLHDNDKSDDQHLLPFDGTIDWEDVIGKLVQNGYKGPVTLELCYRYEYLNNTIEKFYKNGLEVGVKLVEMFENEDEKFNILITSAGFNDINNYVSDNNKELFERISKGKKVLILANAAPEGTGNYVARENVKNNFLNVGAISADVIDINSSNVEDILKYDIVYVLGGNPTHLIELNKTTKLRKILVKFLEKGIYIGESAGSMILCDDLKYAYTIKKGTKPKYDVELDTYKGLNLTQHKIFPHYNKVNEEMEEKIKDYEFNNNEKITRLNDGEIIKIRYTIN